MAKANAKTTKATTKASAAKASAKPNQQTAAKGAAKKSGAPVKAAIRPTGKPAEAPEINATRVIAKLRAAWPIGDATVVRFARLATDADRAKEGAETKGALVLKDAVVWAVAIDQDLRTFSALESHLSGERFGYFLERIATLDHALRIEAAKRAGTTSARGAGATVRSAAIDVRDRFVKRLDRYAGNRAALQDALAGAKGTAATPDDLAIGLRALAALAATWLGTHDADELALLADSGVTKERAAALNAAADSLGGATEDATLAGKLSGTDTGVINIAEGGVLLEMANAKTAIEEARLDDPGIRKLSPGEGTRTYFRVPSHKATAPAQPPPAATAPPTTPAAPAGGAVEPVPAP